MKTDITLKKQATINTGNYSSIQPSVTVTLKDIDVENSEEVYKNLNIITSAMFISEIGILSDCQNNMKKNGIMEFLSNLETDEIQKDFKQAVKDLHENLWKI